MGTRNLTCVYFNGEYKVAQYGQWDGYIDGVGKDVYDFIKKINEKNGWDEFKQELSLVEDISDKELKERWVSAGADPNSDFVNMKVSEDFKEMYPWLQRDAAAMILDYIDKGIVDKVSNFIGFAADSLFCEWAYVLDLDENRFEIYKGFNKNKLDENERFKFLEDDASEEYEPVRLILSYDIENLPEFSEIAEDYDKMVNSN